MAATGIGRFKAILRATEVCELTGLAYSTLYYHIRKGTFPKPVKLGKRASGWRAEDLDVWLASRQIAA